jgi:hypothetical protein
MLIMLKRISKNEANVLAAYEPVESEFRNRAYKKWRNVKVGVSMYGMRLKHVEPDVGILTLTKNSNMRIEDMDMFIDYFPLDEVDNRRL